MHLALMGLRGSSSRFWNLTLEETVECMAACTCHRLAHVAANVACAVVLLF
jgi:hypothetical protein